VERRHEALREFTRGFSAIHLEPGAEEKKKPASVEMIAFCFGCTSFHLSV